MSTILKSKLAPSVAPNLLKRHRLVNVFSQVHTKKLTLVVAGAGYGKTTCVYQALEHMDMKTVWYSLDADDLEFRTFFQYLIAGIRILDPSFGEAILARLQSCTSEIRYRNSFLTELAAEMEDRLHDPVVFVLDDFHLVQDSEMVAECIEFLLLHMPVNVHIVVISRVLPYLRLSLYRARREVIDISERDLAFTLDEVKELSKALIPGILSPDTIDAIHRRSGGWAAALMLICDSARREAWNEIEGVQDLEEGSLELIYEYLEENVFESQPEAIQEFMVKTSLMDWLEPNLCDAFMGKCDSRDILGHLSRNHLLTFPIRASKASYRYHHLFHEFLQEALSRRYSDEAIRSFHENLGLLFESRGDKQHALRHFFHAQGHDQVCRVLSGFTISDLVGCPVRLLNTIVDSLPQDALRRNPRTMHIKARLASLKGDLSGAVQGFQKALERFRDDGDERGVAGCMKDLGFHHYLLGDVNKAFKTMKSLWQVAETSPFFLGEVGGYLVFFASILGRLEEADAFHTSALARITQSRDREAAFGLLWVGFCHSVRHQVAGDFETSQLLTARAIQDFTSAGADLMLPIAHVHAALNAACLRCPEEGIQHAEKGMTFARDLGVLDHQFAWLLYARASNRFVAGDMQACLGDIYEALDIAKGLGNPWTQSAVLELLGRVNLARGDLVQAEKNVRKALSLVSDTGLVVWQCDATLGLVQVLKAQSRFQEALAALEGPEEQWGISSFIAFRRELLKTFLYDAMELEEEAVQSLCTTLSLAFQHGYGSWLVPHLNDLRPLAAKCSTRGIIINSLDSLLTGAEMGLEESFDSMHPVMVHDAYNESRREPGTISQEELCPLSIACLGDFLVAVGGQGIPRERWSNSKATLIFLYLVLNFDKGFIPKDSLLEIAWPEEDPVITNKRFHVALSFLRKLFEPELRRGQSSSYIIRRGDAYRLEIGGKGYIDVHRFMSTVDQAEKMVKSEPDDALILYLEAERLYKGDLLDSFKFEEWFESLRIRLQNRYLLTLSRLMDLFEKAGRLAACIEYAEKYLAIEEFSEPVYRFLMRCHAAQGGLSRVQHVYRRCEQRIVHDMGYPLSDDSIALYEQLKANR